MVIHVANFMNSFHIPLFHSSCSLEYIDVTMFIPIIFFQLQCQREERRNEEEKKKKDKEKADKKADRKVCLCEY